MAKALLITGATGKQGGAVIDALLALKESNKFTILAVTRDASSLSAKKLAAKSACIKLVQGNLDDVPSLFQAAQKAHSEPIWGVYSVQISVGRGVTLESEVAQGKNLIDGAVKAKVKHFVYSSVERGGDERSWENKTPILHFQSKYHIERHLRHVTESGKEGEKMGWTILRPVAFMDNLVPGFATAVFLTALRDTMKDKTLQWVSTSDIGVFAAKAFDAPEKWNHKAIGIAGDELSYHQLSNAFQKVTGQPAPSTYWFLGSALMYMVTEVRLMITWFADEGYNANIRERRKEHPELLNMEDWLAKKSDFEEK